MPKRPHQKAFDNLIGHEQHRRSVKGGELKNIIRGVPISELEILAQKVHAGEMTEKQAKRIIEKRINK